MHSYHQNPLSGSDSLLFSQRVLSAVNPLRRAGLAAGLQEAWAVVFTLPTPEPWARGPWGSPAGGVVVRVRRLGLKTLAPSLTRWCSWAPLSLSEPVSSSVKRV